jgi:FtsZ-binding cell division protein ZapB
MQDDLKTKGEQDEIKLQETELEHDKQTQPTLSQAAADARKRRDELKARRA